MNFYYDGCNTWGSLPPILLPLFLVIEKKSPTVKVFREIFRAIKGEKGVSISNIVRRR